jgi:hypothetical protein
MSLPARFAFVTLDSCRYDAFEQAHAPRLKALGPLHRAMAPSYFTFGSHAAMFVGFTPGVADCRTPYLNPKWVRLFRMQAVAAPRPGALFTLPGANIVQGMRALGYATIGAAAVAWFDPDTATGRVLSADFEQFYYAPESWGLPDQLAFAQGELAKLPPRQPAFVFLNVGETHVPYYFRGAPWEPWPNPCEAFGDSNDAAVCRTRQVACVEYVDALLGPFLASFDAVLLCADHGDCWGEDGLWEHGVSHPKTLEVPLILKLPAAIR